MAIIKYRVNEIFNSIEGEGLNAGYPTTFVRLHGCKLHCSYCDTRYACEGDFPLLMDSEQILQAMQYSGHKRVTLTGGEPLEQDCLPLIKALFNAGKQVNIETNGGHPVGKYQMDGTQIIMDIKCPSSGMETTTCWDNLYELRNTDAVKFVVKDSADLNYIKKVLDKYKPKAHRLVSPVHGKVDARYIASFIQMNPELDLRIQIQLHKYIGFQ